MTNREQLNTYIQQLALITYKIARYELSPVTADFNTTALYLTEKGQLVARIQVPNEPEGTYYTVTTWRLFKAPEAGEVEPTFISSITPGSTNDLSTLDAGTYRIIAYVGPMDELVETSVVELKIKSKQEVFGTDISVNTIHQALLTYTKLERETTGDELGYYMSGIAKMIRYLTDAENPATSSTTESLAILCNKFVDWLGVCSHEITETVYEPGDETYHSKTTICKSCGTTLDLVNEEHQYSADDRCPCGSWICRHRETYVAECNWLNESSHYYVTKCSTCEDVIVEAGEASHSETTCLCGAWLCTGCGTYYENYDMMRQCSNTEDCANYHTHEYTLNGCEPIEDAQHIEYWECRLDGAHYNITENCVLNQECKCGRTLYTCTCEDPGCSCTSVVGEEAGICDNCIRNCTQPGPQEPEATTCQFCGGNHAATDIIDCEKRMYCNNCESYYYTEDGYCPNCPLPGNYSCAECGATYNTQEEADQCNLTTTCPGNRKPEATFCTWCNSTDHSAADIYACPNAVDCPDHGYYVGSKCPQCSGSGEGGGTTSCMCGCGCGNSAGYDGYCDICRNGDCAQEPEATSCIYCGGAHTAESAEDCENMVFCGVNTHDTWYLKWDGCPLCNAGDAGEGPWECPYCHTVYDNYEDFRTCKMMTTCPGSGPEAT